MKIFVLAGLLTTALAQGSDRLKSIFNLVRGERGASQRHLRSGQEGLDDVDRRPFTHQIHKELRRRFEQGLAGIDPASPCLNIQRKRYPGCLWAFCYKYGAGSRNVGVKFQMYLLEKVWHNSEVFKTYRNTLTESGYKCVLEYQAGKDCITPPSDYEFSGCR